MYIYIYLYICFFDSCLFCLDSLQQMSIIAQILIIFWWDGFNIVLSGEIWGALGISDMLMGQLICCWDSWYAVGIADMLVGHLISSWNLCYRLSNSQLSLVKVMFWEAQMTNGAPKWKDEAAKWFWQWCLGPHGNLQGGYLNNWNPSSHSLVAPLKMGWRI